MAHSTVMQEVVRLSTQQLYLGHPRTMVVSTRTLPQYSGSVWFDTKYPQYYQNRKIIQRAL